MNVDDDVRRRLERLESEVARLSAAWDRREDARPDVETLGHLDLTPPAPPRARPAPPPPPTRKPVDPRHWLGIAGGALFFFGMLFVYRFSVEQGLLTPFMRIVLGYLAGAALFVAGVTLRPRARAYGVALEATGLSLLYATSYAATFFYQLVSREVAFVLMDLVSLAGITASVRQKEQWIAVAGLVAALATPFLLADDTSAPGTLALYAAGICLVAALIHWRTGWRLVVVAVTVVGWPVLAVCVALQTNGFTATDGARAMVQLAMLALLLLLWGVPLWRRTRHESPAPLSWIGVAALSNGFALLIGSAVLQDWENGTTALASFGLAALFFGGAWLLAAGKEGKGETSVHLAAGHLMTLIGLALGADALTGEPVWGSGLWALYAALLVAGGVRLKRRPLLTGGLTVLGVTAVKLMLVDFSEGSMLVRAVVFLGVGGLALAMNYWLLPHWQDDDRNG